MTPDIENRIQVLNGSLRCFALGVMGLLPVIGLPFALAALVASGKVRCRQKGMWNPAQSYRVWGVVCAAAGTIFWGIIITILLYQASSRNGG